MKIIAEFPDWFRGQSRSRQLVFGGLGLLLLLSMCGLLWTIFTRSPQQSPSVTVTSQGADNVLLITRTPAAANAAGPTSSITPLGPTRTPLPTGLPTQGLETATIVVLPTNYTARFAIDVLVVITAVDKKLDYVDIQNASGSPVSLDGWVLVSEVGSQSCRLRGILLSKEVLRIWAGNGPVGLSCGFKRNIWVDDGPDPAVLYNSDGQEVSRYPP